VLLSAITSSKSSPPFKSEHLRKPFRNIHPRVAKLASAFPMAMIANKDRFCLLSLDLAEFP
jgi:hypothetical protein